MIVPVLEFAVLPGFHTGDNVCRFVIGERLRADEPQRLQGKEQQKDGRD